MFTRRLCSTQTVARGGEGGEAGGFQRTTWCAGEVTPSLLQRPQLRGQILEVKPYWQLPAIAHS